MAKRKRDYSRPGKVGVRMPNSGRFKINSRNDMDPESICQWMNRWAKNSKHRTESDA